MRKLARYWNEFVLVCSIVGFLCLCFLPIVRSAGTTWYVSQSGGAVAGSLCSGHTTTAASSSLISGPVAGDTIILCGPISTKFAFSTSGTGANPITIQFDQTSNARLSTANCGTVSCWSLNGSNLIVDGGVACGSPSSISGCSATEANNPISYPSGIAGIIEVNLNGTSGATCAAGPCVPVNGYSQVLSLGGSNITLRNLIIRNAYLHRSNSDNLGSSNTFTCVVAYGGGYTVHDVTFHDCSASFNLVGAANSNIQFYNNHLWNINWGFSNGETGGNCTTPGTNISIHDNRWHDMGVWDDSTNSYHHDYIILFADGNYTGCWSHVRIYNNWFQAPNSTHVTAFTYWSGGLYRDFIVFNNLWDNSTTTTTSVSDALMTQSTSDCPSGFQCGNSSGANYHVPTRNNVLTSAIQYYSNTWDGGGPTIVPGNQGCIGTSVQLTFVDNISGGCNQANYSQYYLQPVFVDYNVYANVTATKVFATDCCGYETTLSGWQTLLQSNLYSGGTANPETHSFLSVSGSLGLGTALVPQAGSPALSTPGKNLSSLCTLDASAWINDMQYFCFDTTAGGTRTPTARPPSAAWVPGAYNGTSTPTASLSVTPNPISFGPITVNTAAPNQTVTLRNTGTVSLTGLNASTSWLSDTTNYNISSNTCTGTIAGSGSCTFSLGFTPLSSGSHPATLTFTFTGSNSPYTVNITGSGGSSGYYVQSGSTVPNTNQSSISLTLPAQLSGDLNICNVGWYDQTSSITGINSSNGNTYSPIGTVYVVSGGAGNVGSFLTYFSSNINPGSETFQVTFNGGSTTANDPEIKCAEYSGVTGVETSAITNGSGGNVASPTVTTTNAADVLVGFSLVANAITSGESGWNTRYITTSGNILEDIKPGVTGTFAATATQGAAQPWIMQIVALSPGSPTAATPTFGTTNPPGFYWLSQNVTLSDTTGGSEIVYTTNGTTPSVNTSGGVVNGTLYSSAIPISSGTTNVQAIAWASGLAASPVNSGVYKIGATAASVAWPLKVAGPGARYLTDQNGNPTMLVGDSPWTIMCSMTPTLTGANSVGAFFADRQAHGFNAELIQAVPSGLLGDGCPGVNSSGTPSGADYTDAAFDGTLPFTACFSCSYPSTTTENNYNYADPNSTYFAELDAVINIAAQYGQTILLGSFATTGVSSTGTITSGPLLAGRLSGNSCTGLTNFGKYLGNRYSSYGNIIWFTGEDFQDWPSTTLYNGFTDNQLAACVAAGIASVDPNHLSTEELNYLLSYGNQNTGFSSSQTLNSVYSYDGYDEALLAWNSTPVQPTFWIEGYYEYNQVFTYLSPFPSGGGCTGTGSNIPPSTPSPLYDRATRNGMWWAITSGNLAGVFYGSCVTGNAQIPSAWPTYIDTPGANQIQYFNALFNGINWWLMQPDQTHTVITSGYGTYQAGSSGCSPVGSGAAGPCNLFGDNYATTLWNPNGSVAMVYDPAGNSLTANMGVFTGNVAVEWFDPSNGTFSAISGSPFTNSGSRSFSTPGNNSRGEPDWVLVMQVISGVSTLVPSTLSFPSQNIGTASSAQSIVLTNTGPGAITISSIVTTGDFSQINSCPGTLAANANCTVIITFTPTFIGPRSGSLIVTDNGSNSPETAALSGTGIGFIPNGAIGNGAAIQNGSSLH